MKVNLGSGTHYREDWFNVDISQAVKADQYADLTKDKLALSDNSVDYIEAIDLFEHLLFPTHCFNECWRVLKPQGKMYIEVPYGGTIDYYKDPTHVRPFIPDTFKYYAEWNTSPAYEAKKWEILQSRFTLGGENNNRIFVTMQPVKEGLE
jgi:SAM-dependent methyltransferase